MSLVEHGLDELIVRKLGLDGRQARPGRLARPGAPAPQSRSTRSASPWWASTPSTATPTSRSTSRWTTPASPTTPRSASSGSTARRSSAKGPSGCCRASTACSCPAGSASGASRARSTRSASPAQRGIPFFGICLGMQCAVVEFARNVVGLAGANSTEFDKDNPHPVICLLDEQKTITDKGGTMRLGAQPTVLGPGSRAAACYGRQEISERHRHRYEFNNVYRAAVRRPRDAGGGHQPRRRAGRDRRDPRASLVRGRAVPSGVQVAADAAPSAVRRLHRRGGQASQRAGRAAVGDERDEPADRHDRRPQTQNRSEQLAMTDKPADTGRKEDHHRRRLEVAGRGGKGSSPAARPASPRQSRSEPAREQRARCPRRRSIAGQLVGDAGDGRPWA